MIVIGVGAAGLMPTALSLGSHRQARSSEVALMQGASQFGFTAAVLAASALLAAFAGPTIYQMILLIAIAIYIAINVTAISTLRRLDTTQVTVLPDQEQELKPSTVFIFEPCEASAFVVCPDQTETTSAAGETERGIVSSLNPGAPMPAPRRYRYLDIERE